MRKGLIIFLIIALLFAFTACGENNADENENPRELTENEKIAAGYAEKAYGLSTLIKEEFWHATLKGAVLGRYPNRKSQDTSFYPFLASVWPYTVSLAAFAGVYPLFESDENLRDDYVCLLESLEYYRTPRTNETVYGTGRGASYGKGNSNDTYYDDNVWVAKEFLNAYETFGDETYLTKAAEVAEYVWSGWADDDLGGIFWREQGKLARHACSNAPASIIFSRLYNFTKQQKYLDRAVKTYDFCRRELMDVDGVYFDHIKNEGVIAKAKYTYNTGSMISAGVRLYEITGDEKYMDDALFSASGSFNHFFKENADYDFRVVVNQNVWFNLLLLDGYLDVFKHTGDFSYLAEFELNMNYAYDNLRAEIGFMPADWTKGFPKDDDGNLILKNLDLLDMSSNAEFFARFAEIYYSLL